VNGIGTISAAFDLATIKQKSMQPLNWSNCSLVEIDPLRVNGRPVLKGTRMPVEDIIANYEYGVSVREISEQFRIPAQTIAELLGNNILDKIDAVGLL